MTNCKNKNGTSHLLSVINFFTNKGFLLTIRFHGEKGFIWLNTP